jgi:hypothetical protein
VNSQTIVHLAKPSGPLQAGPGTLRVNSQSIVPLARGLLRIRTRTARRDSKVSQGECSYRRPGVGRPPRITSARPYEQLPSSSSRSGMLVYRFIAV